jgi:hypothetical protein
MQHPRPMNTGMMMMKVEKAVESRRETSRMAISIAGLMIQQLAEPAEISSCQREERKQERKKARSEFGVEKNSLVQ